MTGAIVLAAGASRRMGSNKLLLPFAGISVIRHIVGTFSRVPIPNIVVVTGHNPGALHEELAEFSVRFAHNENYESGGMLSSVRCGLMSLDPSCDSVFIALGDHPTLDLNILRSMLTVHENGATIVVPAYQGRRGHPLLMNLCHKNAVMTRYSDTGLRGLLREYEDAVVEVDCPNYHATLDMDTPDEYKALLKEHEQR